MLVIHVLRWTWEKFYNVPEGQAVKGQAVKLIFFAPC